MNFRLQHERRGRVDAGLELAVEHVETLGVRAEEFHFRDEVAGVLLLLALLLNEPVEHLHGAEVAVVIRGGIDAVDERGDVLLVLERLFQRGHVVAARPVRRVDGAEADGDTVIEQVLEKQQEL